MRANRTDLDGLLLRQRVMRDVSRRDQRVTVLGQDLAMPVILAPVGLGGMMARRAEVQAARAAFGAGIPFVESTVSICSIEEVAAATPRPPWFQLYVMRDRSYAEDLMARARAASAPVLVLTVDLAVVGARHRDTRNAVVGTYPAWINARRAFDLVSHPQWIRNVPIEGRPLTFGNLEKAVPEARTSGRVQGVGRRPVRSQRHVGRCGLGARALGRTPARQGGARPRGRAAGRRRRCRRDRRLQPRRSPARLRSLDGPRACPGRRRGRRPGRDPRRRRGPDRARCGQDDRAGRASGSDRSRLGLVGGRARRGRGQPHARRSSGPTSMSPSG